MNIRNFVSAFVLLAILVFNSCATSNTVKSYSGSKSHFRHPPIVNADDVNKYPDKDIYRAYKRGGSGFVAIGAVRNQVQMYIEKFALKQGKNYVILAEQFSNPPYIAGNFPRVEIVFALVDKNNETNNQTQIKKTNADKLKELKKMLDDKIITEEEYDKLKQKIIEE